ncbi:adenylate/guanylate cyclase domain-containing protein [Methylocapsa acidiphila]|uniref:adenylate/guanylate cyclase domain-containing protein n=1 Tax=Methylocapsa acidiphila TaxID=133552 RepID=UPI0018DB0986|nr:adenylate/guanylate cyclase domain-containing protein [Methylocapsa acidiphila]
MTDSAAAPPKGTPIERPLRLATGLTLFAFAASHFLNHAFGIFRLDVMEAVRVVLIWPWRTLVGQAALYGSFIIHGGLGLYAIFRRRHFWIPKAEMLQLLLGLSIPPLVIIHATNVRLGHLLFGLDLAYPGILHRYWDLSPHFSLPRQFVLLLVVWIHGCIGLNSWLRAKPWYQRRLPALAALAVLIPSLAIVGLVDGGRDFDERAAQDKGFLARNEVQTKAQTAALGAIGERLILIYLGLVGAVFAFQGAREWREKRFGAVSIRYPGGVEVNAPRGFSILEASRWAGIAHMSMCGGRARCSTCRVLVLAGLDLLPSPNAAETRTLAWIGAYHKVRLACQVRPTNPIAVVPLLSPQNFDPSLGPPVFAASEERVIAALFIDLRDSTRLADGRLPYDSLYVVDRYVSIVCRAVETHGGQVTSVAGDGIMSFFGADCDAPTACRHALLALRDIWRALAAFSEECERAFDFQLRFGAGCHVGLAVVGELASRHSTQFLGEVGNIAARLEGLTKELECAALLSRALIEQAGLATTAAESHRVQIRNVSAEIEMIALRAQDDLDHLLAARAGRVFEQRRRFHRKGLPEDPTSA